MSVRERKWEKESERVSVVKECVRERAESERECVSTAEKSW